MSYLLQVESKETIAPNEKKEEVVSHAESKKEKKEEIVAEKVVPNHKKNVV